MSSPVATNALVYNEYVTHMGTMAIVETQTVAGVVQGVDPAFNDLIPNMLNYAELRIQRDLNLLGMEQTILYTATIGSGLLVSTNDFVDIYTVNVLGFGPVFYASKAFEQTFYVGAPNGLPVTYYTQGGDNQSLYTGDTILIGLSPPPDQAYTVGVTGTVRMPSLYLYSVSDPPASTATTFISTWYPDLLIMASMIYLSGFQRNWGRQSDDPSMGLSYEQQYQTLLKGAVVEEARKRFQSGAWGPQGPTPIATPSR